MDTPFGMSFDELIAQVESNNTAAQETPAPETNQTANTPAQGLSFEEMAAQATGQDTPAQGLSFEEMVAQATSQDAPAQAAPTEGLSFDEMVAQATGQTTPAQETNQVGGLSFEDMVAQATGQKAESASKASSESVSFEELVEQAKAQAGMTSAESPAKDEEASVSEEAKNEAPTGASVSEEAKNEAPAGASVSEEAKNEAPAENAFGMNPPEVSETAEEEPAQKAKPRRRKKKTAAEQQPETPIVEDKTADYEVEIPGVTAPKEEPIALGALFTKDEVAALRADIQTFVRNELKRAMVGALKDVLHDFTV